MCNQSFKLNTGYTQKQLIGKNVVELMPSVIAAKHSKMVDKFFAGGSSDFINKPQRNFIIKNNKSITLIQMLIKFHYSNELSYSYIGFFNQVAEIQFQSSSLVH